jgi:hypothetical protein
MQLIVVLLLIANTREHLNSLPPFQGCAQRCLVSPYYYILRQSCPMYGAPPFLQQWGVESSKHSWGFALLPVWLFSLAKPHAQVSDSESDDLPWQSHTIGGPASPIKQHFLTWPFGQTLRSSSSVGEAETSATAAVRRTQTFIGATYVFVWWLVLKWLEMCVDGQWKVFRMYKG